MGTFNTKIVAGSTQIQTHNNKKDILTTYAF